MTAAKIYFPNEGQIQVHQQRVCQYPPELVPGYYWYGKGQRSAGRTPRWVEDMQIRLCSEIERNANTTDDNPTYDNAEVNPDKDDDVVDDVDDDNIVKDNEESTEHNLIGDDSVSMDSSVIFRHVPQDCPYSLRSSTSIPLRFRQ